jgi:transcriptional regulator with XRE-family HTH domain
MVNTDDFIKRLENILDYYSLSASGFADKIGVQRSSLSHLLSGRNKPSLDFILKIIEIFPEVDLYWILNGKGNFPKSDTISIPEIEKKVFAPTPIFDTEIKNDLFSEIEKPILENINLKNENIISENYKIPKNENVERIVIFYTNGTFSEYSPK